MVCEDTRRYAGLQRSGRKMVLPYFCSLKINLRRNQDSEKKVPITKAMAHFRQGFTGVLRIQRAEMGEGGTQ